MLRFVLLSILAFPLVAQDRIGTVQVRVSTDRSDWRYEPGQPVRFRIVAVQDGHALSGIKVTYRIGPEMMPPKIDQTATLTDEGLTVDGGTMNEPGFLRCIATVEQNGKTYRGLATAAFRPETIKPTQQEPADFDQFWAAGKAALAKLPIDAKITPLPEYGNASADCYQVNLQNVGMGAAPSRFYGVLCEPKAPGKYPALLSVPGAGVRPYRGLAEMAGRGIITLQVGIHGIPVTMEQSVYDSLGAGALANYNTFGLDNRDRYYYRRVYLGCVRANDFLTSHPKWDGVNSRRYRRQSGRSTVYRYRRARPACPRPGRVLPGAFRCHRVPAQSRRRLAAHVPCRRRPAVTPLAGQDRDLALLRRCQLRPARQSARPLLLGLQRRDVPAYLHVLGLQRNSRAEEIAPGARNRPQQYPRTSC